MPAAGYWCDVADFRFDDATSSTWIQAMPLGDYEHPVYGPIGITSERVQHFVDNVKNAVRGQDLDIDYDHKAYGGEAAGWVKDAENRGSDGLWLKVNWTPTAYAKLKEGAYRYFSPEFDDSWTHPKTNVTHQDVIFGGAITNRPFLKDILPINMSEVFQHASIKPNEGGKKVKLSKEAAAKLGLTEDPTDEEVQAALDALETPKVVDPSKDDKPEGEVQLSETDKALKTLSESNPIVKHLMEQNKQFADQLAENTTALHLSETNATVKRLTEKAAAAKVGLAQPAVDELTNTLLGIRDKKLSESVVKGFESLIDAKVVELGERGRLHKDDPEAGEVTALGELNKAVKKLTDASGDKMSYGDAMNEVARSQPELYRNYRLAVGAGVEN